MTRAIHHCDHAAPTGPRGLECLEVWGGNVAASTSLSVTGIDLTIWSQPWRNQAQGGDIFLVSMCACAAISRFMLADVAGHGVEVAPLAQRLRKLMGKHVNKPDQGRLAQAINREFAQYAKAGRFATALLLTYLPEKDELVVCNAGHPPPLLYRAATRRWQPLDPAEPKASEVIANLPLGIVPGTDYPQFHVQLEQGDHVALFSDGIIEARDNDGRQLRMTGLQQRLEHIEPDPVDRFAPRIVEMATPTETTATEDDRTIVVLSHHAADPPRQSLGEKLRVLTKLAVMRAGGW